MRKSLLVLDQGFPTINGGVGGSVRSGIEFADRLQTNLIQYLFVLCQIRYLLE